MAKETLDCQDESLATQKTELGNSSGDHPPNGHSRLEGPRAGTVLGRYVVLSQLGAGGMGVVFAAFDPELDRKVAIKLVSPHRSLSEASRLRLQHEAQALARLSHPNVVSVYDVGVYEQQVFVAMEFVQGSTLAKWLHVGGEQPRRWQEILRCLQAAGKGLCAAHEQHLIHRDFKPDNVIVGDDGRVRVMDFGLVRAHRGLEESAPLVDLEGAAVRRSDALGSQTQNTIGTVGTVGYMSPEQLKDVELASHSDQFSFFVTLYEALYGHSPFTGETAAEYTYSVLYDEVREPAQTNGTPRWLHRILLKGLKKDPLHRFGSMAEALEALSSGEVRRRRARVSLVVGGASLIVASLVGYQYWDRAAQESQCVQAGDTIRDVWNGEARQAVSEGLRATGVSFAETTAHNVTQWIDRNADEWREQRIEVCMNVNIHETWDESKSNKAVWCLEDQRHSITALIDVLRHADQADAQMAVQSAARLEPASQCGDDSVLAGMPALPDTALRQQISEVRAELSRAVMLHKAGKLTESLSAVREARRTADTIGWQPVLALALSTEAGVLLSLGDHAASEAAAMDAYTKAARASAWQTAALAATELAFIVGYLEKRHEEGMLWATHAETAILHGGDPVGLREASRLTSISAIYAAQGEYEKAIELNMKSLEIVAHQMGSQHPNTAVLLSNLSVVNRLAGSYSEAERLADQTLEIWDKTLGSEHPMLAKALGTLAEVHLSTGHEEEAIPVLERMLRIQEKTFGTMDHRLTQTLLRTGDAHRTRGKLNEAQRSFERAVQIVSQGNGSEHEDIAAPLRELGEVLLTRGQFAAASEYFNRALAVSTENRAAPERVASLRFSLARSLWGKGEARPSADVRRHALSEATRALEQLNSAGKDSGELHEKVEVWLQERNSLPEVRGNEPD